MQQVDGIFSKGHACGGKAINDLGRRRRRRRRAGRSQPISLYGRNSASGTYGYFKEHALCKGDYKDTVKEQPGSASVVQGVTEDRFAHRLQRHRLQDLGRARRPASPPRPAASASTTARRT